MKITIEQSDGKQVSNQLTQEELETVITEHILEAFQKPNGEAHQTVAFYSQVLGGFEQSDDETYEDAARIRSAIWYCQQQIFSRGITYDLGTCPIQFCGLKIHASSDSVSETNTYLSGFYDELCYLFQLQVLLRPHDSAIDVGANIGCHSMAYSKMLPNGHVYSFEPNGLSIERFKKNCKLNNIENVTLFQELLSDKKIGLPFNNDNENYNKGVGRVELDNKNIIMANTLDSHVEDFKGNIRLIKIDVEGHEINVLLGAQKLLAAYKPYVFVEYNRDKWKISDLTKAIPFEHTIEKLPYTSFEKVITINEKDDPEGFTNLLISPKRKRENNE